jgi:hypothetical protein
VLLAASDDTAPDSGVVEGAQGHLHHGDRYDRQRRVELAAGAVRQTDACHQPVLQQAGQRPDRRQPRHLWVRRMQQVGVEGHAVESQQAGLAVAADRRGAPV